MKPITRDDTGARKEIAKSLILLKGYIIKAPLKLQSKNLTPEKNSALTDALLTFSQISYIQVNSPIKNLKQN